MCGRYVSKAEAAMERDWALARKPPKFESYNVAPSQLVPVVRTRDGDRDCGLIRWGLVPFWAKGIPPKLSTINARVETMATAASYRGPWKRSQRCILPALGFYEWQLREGGKQPYFIHLTDRELFGFAGLWDQSTTLDGKIIESCTIITLPANRLLAEIHNGRERMPAILPLADHGSWLEGDGDAAMRCLTPYPDELMDAYPVSTKVNSPKNNGPELLAPLG
jgi:putative SOS response-associated peptidase YedK